MVFEVDVDFNVSGIRTRRVRGIDLRECSTGLHPGNYPPELSVAELILRYTKGNYVYEKYVYTEHNRYIDAPPNAPVTPSRTYGTVRMSTEGVATGVEYELEVFPTVGFSVNHPIMNVWYGFSEKNVEMGRYTKWEAELGAANWLKPNPASVVV
jgi:hypothetical protein